MIRQILLLALTISNFSFTANGQAAGPVTDDSLSLSLKEALERGTIESEEVRIAEAQMGVASQERKIVFSNALPTISSELGYTRTFDSIFDTGFGGTTDPGFLPNPNLALEDRVRYIEQNASSAVLGTLGDAFSGLPFGRDHAYRATFSLSQHLYSGGRLRAGYDVARQAELASAFQYIEAVDEVNYEVKIAYYRASLARELVNISESVIAQAQGFLDEERLRFRAGRASDLGVLRAEVALENLRPRLVEAQNALEISMLNLKRLINIPLEEPLRLTTQLEMPTTLIKGDTTRVVSSVLETRGIMRSAHAVIAAREQQVRLTEGSFLPSVSLNMDYGKQLFPNDLFGLNDESWRTDWTLGLRISIPIISGFRRSAEVQRSRINLQRAKLERDQLREGLRVEYEQAAGEQKRAASLITARQQTVNQAARVHDLTVLRYEKGLATQLDISDARLALQQARTNLVQALADYHIATARVKRSLGN